WLGLARCFGDSGSAPRPVSSFLTLVWAPFFICIAKAIVRQFSEKSVVHHPTLCKRAPVACYQCCPAFPARAPPACRGSRKEPHAHANAPHRSTVPAPAGRRSC